MAKSFKASLISEAIISFTFSSLKPSLVGLTSTFGFSSTFVSFTSNSSLTSVGTANTTGVG